jgi:hypothetical protein
MDCIPHSKKSILDYFHVKNYWNLEIKLIIQINVIGGSE